VTDLIFLHSQGIPRKINVISDAGSLRDGEDQRIIDVELTNIVLEELQSTGVMTRASFSPHSISVRSPVQSRNRPLDVASRAAADAQRDRQEAERRLVLQERWIAARSQVPDATALPDQPAVTPVSRPAARDSSEPATLRAVPLRPALSGADPYYGAPRQSRRSGTLWSRVRHGWWGKAKAAVGE
jgi:hypothetical protein